MKNTLYQDDAGHPTVKNSYSAGTVLVQDGNLGGGFIGGAQSATITNNFTAAPITQAEESSSAYYGAFLGAFFDGEADNGVLEGNYLDVARKAAESCVSDFGGDWPGCTGVNYGEGTGGPDYFFGNHTNPPLDQWDFECVWQTQYGDYPVLRPYSPDCSDTSDTSDSPSNAADATNTPITLPTGTITPPRFFSSTTTNDSSPQTIYLNALTGYANGNGQELGGLKEGQVIDFDITVNGNLEHHTITIKKISYSSITITVASDPFDMTIQLNNTKTVVLNGQKIMSIKLSALAGDTATLYISRIDVSKTASRAISGVNAVNGSNTFNDSQHTSTVRIVLALVFLILLVTSATFVAKHRTIQSD